MIIIRQADVPRFTVEDMETDEIGERHAGEQDEHVGQAVDLVEGFLVFLNQWAFLLKEME